GVQDRGQADVADDAGLEALEQLLRAQLQLASRLRISECMSNQVGSLRGARPSWSQAGAAPLSGHRNASGTGPRAGPCSAVRTAGEAISREWNRAGSREAEP